ncbi:DNA-3-methyladenine glycosylase [bacterium]|nr:MAG: DNA-3-methyladenine glycosylase [bacterium]
MSKTITKQYFARDTLLVARSLIGCVLNCDSCSGRIVEVEAYTDDEASHGHRRTERSALMHDTYGHVYVYFIYGMYHCLNFTTDRNSSGAVLIRAIEPLSGIEIMQHRRKTANLRNLCSGPGKLCQAFAIDMSFNGSRIGEKITLKQGISKTIATSSRVGIKKATELEWRFFEKDNPFVSR